MWNQLVREWGNIKEPQMNKEGEGVTNLPSHATSSQKDVSINKEINTKLSISSQKDLDIEKSFNPGAENTKGITKAKTITPYFRKKKGVKTQLAHGEHTLHTLGTSNLENVPSTTTPFDASQTNAEMQLLLSFYSPFFSIFRFSNFFWDFHDR